MTENQGFTKDHAHTTGSPHPGEPSCVCIGRIRRPHGVKGEVIFELYPEYPVKLKTGTVLLIGKKKEAYSIDAIRKMDQNYLLHFDGMADCDAVQTFRNQLVYLHAEHLEEAPEGRYYPHQVLGMRVFDENGNYLGKLVEVMLTGANDVYMVKLNEDSEEILIPAVDSFIVKVDDEKKEMIVNRPIWD
jgi:16S rRNA processing protein RimM